MLVCLEISLIGFDEPDSRWMAALKNSENLNEWCSNHAMPWLLSGLAWFHSEGKGFWGGWDIRFSETHMARYWRNKLSHGQTGHSGNAYWIALNTVHLSVYFLPINMSGMLGNAAHPCSIAQTQTYIFRAFRFPYDAYLINQTCRWSLCSPSNDQSQTKAHKICFELAFTQSVAPSSFTTCTLLRNGLTKNICRISYGSTSRTQKIVLEAASRRLHFTCAHKMNMCSSTDQIILVLIQVRRSYTNDLVKYLDTINYEHM